MASIEDDQVGFILNEQVEIYNIRAVLIDAFAAQQDCFDLERARCWLWRNRITYQHYLTPASILRV